MLWAPINAVKNVRIPRDRTSAFVVMAILLVVMDSCVMVLTDVCIILFSMRN